MSFFFQYLAAKYVIRTLDKAAKNPGTPKQQLEGACIFFGYIAAIVVFSFVILPAIFSSGANLPAIFEHTRIQGSFVFWLIGIVALIFVVKTVFPQEGTPLDRVDRVDRPGRTPHTTREDTPYY